jgi:hypothetical protein
MLRPGRPILISAGIANPGDARRPSLRMLRPGRPILISAGIANPGDARRQTSPPRARPAARERQSPDWHHPGGIAAPGDPRCSPELAMVHHRQSWRTCSPANSGDFGFRVSNFKLPRSGPVPTIPAIPLAFSH